MTIEVWDSHELYALQRDDRLDDLPSYFKDTFFRESYFSDDQKIRFSQLPRATRVLAPFVLPMEQGKPIYRRKSETLTDITPPYIKPKDAVRPEDARNVLPSEVFRNGGVRPSLAQRFDSRVVDVTQFHLRAIEMQKAWMAARAVVDAKIVIKYERDQGAADPNVTLDFGRSAGNTVTLGAGLTWDDPDADILGNLETWMNTMYLLNQGGSANQLTVGAAVAPLFKKNTGVIKALDTRYRGNQSVNIDMGILRQENPRTYIGTLGAGLEVWHYRDQVENDDGTLVEIFDPRDILLTCPNTTGVMAYGAIMDDAAIAGGLSSVDVFPKMWREEDPGVTFIMHQSAPLPIPLFPNRTFKARVLQ